MFQVLAMAAHHLQLHKMTDTDDWVNAYHIHNFIMEMAKRVEAEGRECREMIHTLASFKKNMVRAQGITVEIIQNWAKQNIEYLRSTARMHWLGWVMKGLGISRSRANEELISSNLSNWFGNLRRHWPICRRIMLWYQGLTESEHKMLCTCSLPTDLITSATVSDLSLTRADEGLAENLKRTLVRTKTSRLARYDTRREYGSAWYSTTQTRARATIYLLAQNSFWSNDNKMCPTYTMSVLSSHLLPLSIMHCHETVSRARKKSRV